MRVGGQRGDLRREVCPGGMSDQCEPGRVGTDMVDADVQDTHGVVNRRQRVGQEVLRHRAHIVLIAGKMTIRPFLTR